MGIIYYLLLVSIQANQVLLGATRLILRIVEQWWASVWRGPQQAQGVGRDRQAFMRQAPEAGVKLIKLVASQLKQLGPFFTFTLLQVVVNGTAGMHVDQGNSGPSCAIALGPIC